MAKKLGRGWHGNREAHAKAGRVGGIASGKTRRKQRRAI